MHGVKLMIPLGSEQNLHAFQQPTALYSIHKHCVPNYEGKKFRKHGTRNLLSEMESAADQIRSQSDLMA